MNDLQEKCATTGALTSALAYAFCWQLPLLLASFGLGSFSLSLWLAQYRWVFIAVTAVLLVFAYWRVYRPGGRRAGPWTRWMMHVTALFSVGLVAVTLLRSWAAFVLVNHCRGVQTMFDLLKPGKNKTKNATGCWAPKGGAGGRRSHDKGVDTTGPTAAPATSTEHCMVCGAPLEYGREARRLTCTYCGTVTSGHIRCPAGHYVCDRCHDRDVLETVTTLCRTTTLTDPLAIAELAMAAPGLPMLGCGHAVIAGGALAAALRNHGVAAFTADHALEEILQRIDKQAHGGYCGLTGVCGIVVAVGACVSLLTGATCGTDREQRLTMTAVTRTAEAITNLTGPSCCKAYVRAALAVAVEFLAAECNVVLPAGAVAECRHMAHHPHGCREQRCPYFPRRR